MRAKVMNWLKNNKRDYYYDKNGIEVPESVPILYNWDDNNIIGVAYNFNKEEDGLYCDIKLDNDCFLKAYIVPSFISIGGVNPRTNIIDECEITSLSAVIIPDDDRIKPIGEMIVDESGKDSKR